MKKYLTYILLLCMAFVFFAAPANAQKKRNKAKQTTVKKKQIKTKSQKQIKTKSKKVKTVKIAKKNTNEIAPTVAEIKTTLPQINKDTLPDKVVTILSAFKPQLKNIAKIDFVNASERIDTGSVNLDYQVPSQNLSFQYRPIALVPRSFKMDSISLLQSNTILQFGYGNYFHHYINIDHYFVDKLNNAHSFNVTNEAITGEHHLQSTRSLGLSYLGDFVFKNNDHIVSKIYYEQIGRYRYGLVPDASTLPLDNFKQNSFLTGIQLNWLKSANKKTGSIQYLPSLIFERFEGIEGAKNHFLSLNSPLGLAINANARFNFDFAYSMSQFTTRALTNSAKHLIRIDPNLVFNKYGSTFKIGFSTALLNNELRLYPDITFKKALKDTNVVLNAGWHANLNNNTYTQLVVQNPWIAVPTNLEISSQDAKFIGLTIYNGKRLEYGFSLSLNDYINLLLFNKKINTNLLNNGLYYQSLFENKASTIQLDAHLRYQFSDHLLVTNQFKYIQFNALQVNAKPWGILPLELNSKITWTPNSALQLSGDFQYWTGSTQYNESKLPYDLGNALVLNAAMTYKLAPHFNAWVKAENLLDKPYQRWSNYPSLGVQFIAGVVYSFK